MGKGRLDALRTGCRLRDYVEPADFVMFWITPCCFRPDEGVPVQAKWLQQHCQYSLIGFVPRPFSEKNFNSLKFVTNNSLYPYNSLIQSNTYFHRRKNDSMYLITSFILSFRSNLSDYLRGNCELAWGSISLAQMSSSGTLQSMSNVPSRILNKQTLFTLSTCSLN